MFTGIVTGIGSVRDITPIGPEGDMRLVINAPWSDTASIAPGASIACAGCCLTAIALGPDWFAADVSAETLSKTGIGDWRVGTQMNLERALRLGDELGGHIVSGHVDGRAELLSATPVHGSACMRFRAPARLARFIAPKGSVSLDGVSLTVNAVERDCFTVNIVPHTASVTTLGGLRPGNLVHIEIDMLARYVARLQEASCPN